MFLQMESELKAVERGLETCKSLKKVFIDGWASQGHLYLSSFLKGVTKNPNIETLQVRECFFGEL